MPIGTPTKIKIREGLELLQESDLEIEFKVTGSERFVVHFKNPGVVGVAFAVLKNGSNPFTLRSTTAKTHSYVWSERELAACLVDWEAETSPGPDKPGPVKPMLPPIIIPPGI